jgi:N-methylhydantoinase B
VSLDPIALTVLGNALAGVAEEMGALLVRGSFSANIKERRDSSCALFDPDGRMVAQAAHVPVHLGSLPETVAAVRDCDPQPGDVFIVNDPYTGGSHLPDITLVAPLAVEGAIAGYGAVRAHHADVGGMRPGSMPPGARELLQEGLVIPPVRLIAAGRHSADVWDLLLANMRLPEERRGDLDAQIAALRLAERRLTEIVERYGEATVRGAFDDMLAYAERRTREALSRIPDGTYRAEDVLEGDGVTADDIPIRAAVEIAGDRITVDFAGTSPAVAGNVNCPIAVTRAACLFALRVLLPTDVTMNAGVAAPLTISAPPGCLVDARPPSAVAAGNVETSGRIADVVLAALGLAVDLPAQGQGTMNNLVLGGAGWSMYETIGGGQGASAVGPGPSGVHVTMSNTRNTPVEALELEIPVRVRRYELRYGSGGGGLHAGGDGVVREVEVLAPAALSLVADRRRHPPRGARGGGDGALGAHWVNGEPVPGKVGRDLAAGDVVTVETPGGGGWGQERAPGP